jgi:DNA-binding NarL/FixJ family response regulator
MNHPANFQDAMDHRDLKNDDAVIDPSPTCKIILLIESRPLMGEIFSHALKEAADDIDVRIVSNLGEIGTQASLAVLSFIQRSSDPLFIAFVLQQLKARLGNLPLLVITDSADPAIGRIMAESGVQNWMTASMGFGAIVAAIRQALTLTASTESRPSNGHVLLDAPAFGQMRPIAERSLRSEIHLTLTDREIDVLALLQKGKQNKVIAHALNISESTAKVHIRNIMRKFHLRNRTEVAVMCGAPVHRPDKTMLTGPDFEDGQMAIPAIAD